MKLLKIAAAVFVLGGVIALSLGCSSDSTSTANTQTATVQRGNLTVSITGTGNLVLSRTENLAFEMAGTVEEVLVDEGESVIEGQELVKLDTSEWDAQLKTLQTKLVTAQRALVKAERAITDAELAVRQAELDLQTAENNLNQIAAVKVVQDDIDNTEAALEFAKMVLASGGGLGQGISFWCQQIIAYTEQLTQLKKELQDILSGTSVSISSDVALQVAKAQLQVEKSQRQLEEAQITADYAQLDKEYAEQAVEDAQSALDEAKSLSPIIKAPFDGFVTKVNVEGGDEVLKGTVAIAVADPNKFEADILVSEMDISQVKLGGNAIVEVEALSGLSLSANVTHISPTATIQSGVVNYKVTVELQPLPSVSENMTGQMPGFPPVSDNVSGQRPSFPPISDNVSGQGQIPQWWAGGQTPSATTTQAIQLKQGMTVTVDIIVQQRSNVLLIPNGAITTQGGQSYVQVISSSGTTEQRAIKTGITDYVNTEVTEGLSEGEKVIVPKMTTSTSTTTQRGSQGAINFPGMGGPP
jgi:multidrug efflux pump subunit AcrA (membrane-fusion protein)